MTRSIHRSLPLSLPRSLLILAAPLMLLLAGSAQAADDPSIKGETRTGIQAAMKSFVEDAKAKDGTLLHYDPVDGSLLRLRLVELHEGIVHKGHFYVSCADFQDEAGKVYDLDFLVVPTESGFRVNQAIVHKADGKKRPYHVEQRWPGLF